MNSKKQCIFDELKYYQHGFQFHFLLFDLKKYAKTDSNQLFTFIKTVSKNNGKVSGYQHLNAAKCNAKVNCIDLL